MGKRSESNKMEISSVAKKKKKKRSRETEGTQKKSDLEVESPPHEKTTEAERKSHMDSQTKAKKRKRERKSHMTEPSPAAIKTPNPPSERRKVRKRTSLSICHLPPKLVGKKILGRVPITSLSAVRSTCTLWNSLSREWILGKAAARQQFLGFMSLDSKVCSVRFHLLDKDKGGLVDLSIKHVDVLGQVEVSKVYYCKGLLLCVLKDNYSSLVVWNPYLGQTRWIKPRVNFNFNMADTYALGYDKKSRSHKILRFLDIVSPIDAIPHEVYDFSSDSWRVLDVTPHWEITYYHRGASLKGNSYFFAQEKIVDETITLISQYENFLLCFDFTSERFGPPLALPFESYINDPVTLACVKEEQLAVLYQRSNILQIWVTTKIDPNSVSWSRFLKVDMFPLCGFRFYYEAASFFIDEEKKVAVVFEFDDDDDHKTTTRYNTAYIIGDDGYFKSVNLGKAQHPMSFPLVCSSSYLPSLVQITRKGTARDV